MLVLFAIMDLVILTQLVHSGVIMVNGSLLDGLSLYNDLATSSSFTVLDNSTILNKALVLLKDTLTGSNDQLIVKLLLTLTDIIGEAYHYMFSSQISSKSNDVDSSLINDILSSDTDVETPSVQPKKIVDAVVHFYNISPHFSEPVFGAPVILPFPALGGNIYLYTAVDHVYLGQSELTKITVIIERIHPTTGELYITNILGYKIPELPLEEYRLFEYKFTIDFVERSDFESIHYNDRLNVRTDLESNTKKSSPYFTAFVEGSLIFRKSVDTFLIKVLSQSVCDKIDDLISILLSVIATICIFFSLSIIISTILLTYYREKMNYYFRKFLSFFNNDLMNFSDFLFPKAVFLSVLAFIFFSSLYSRSESMSVLFVATLIVFVSLCIFLPIIFFSLYTIYFLVFLRGDSNSTSFVTITLRDIITLLSFILRFLVQAIRIAIVCSVLFLLNDFIFVDLFLSSLSSIESTLLVSIARFIFEFIDALIILFLQIFAFVSILFWLFSFIFTAKDVTKYENHFNEKFTNKK